VSKDEKNSIKCRKIKHIISEKFYLGVKNQVKEKKVLESKNFRQFRHFKLYTLIS
jgi:hypothetical protein